MISVLTNMSSLRASTAINDAGFNIARSLQRLSTGKRINSAADDPAGLVAVTHLNTAEADLNAEIRGLQFRQFEVDATEGGLSSITEMLQELNALTVSAANTAGMSNEERESLQLQADSILATIDILGNTTEFKGARILTGVNAGALGHTEYTATVNGLPATKTGTLADLRRGGALNLVSGDTEAAQKSVKAALDALTTRRGSLGAESKSIDSSIRAKQVELENTVAARSQIEDTDYAEEVGRLAREQTRQQAALYVSQLAQQQRASVVLDLLKSVVPTGK